MQNEWKITGNLIQFWPSGLNVLCLFYISVRHHHNFINLSLIHWPSVLFQPYSILSAHTAWFNEAESLTDNSRRFLENDSHRRYQRSPPLNCIITLIICTVKSSNSPAVPQMCYSRRLLRHSPSMSKIIWRKIILRLLSRATQSQADKLLCQINCSDVLTPFFS